MGLEVSGARSELEKSRAREQWVEAEARVELQAQLSAEIRFADESKAHGEECRRVLHRIQARNELESVVQGERVKALEVEAEKK